MSFDFNCSYEDIVATQRKVKFSDPRSDKKQRHGI